jgi:flagellar basal body-associated protein FliL
LLLPCSCSVAAALVRSSSCTRRGDEEVSADSGEGEQADAKDTKKEKARPKARGQEGQGRRAEVAPAIYVEVQPPFVVNFDAKGVMRFLQVSMQVMTRDHETSELIKLHDPKIRNNMLLLLGSQTYDTISTMEGEGRAEEEGVGDDREDR